MNPNNDTPSIRFAGFTDLPAGRQALGKWCVYVLECDDGSLYKGKTNDLIRRISEHMKGHGAEHTQKHKPVKLVYFEAFKSEKEALEKEKYLKTGSGREWLKVHLQKYLPLDYSRELEYDHYAWEQRRLGELCAVFKSGEFIKASDISEEGGFPVYGGNGLRGFADRFNYDGNYALIGRQGALCGNMNYSTGKAYFTEHAVAVQANDNYSTRFLFYLLDTMNLGQYSAQSAQPGLAVNKLITLPALCPTKAEQESIAVFLTQIDDLITLHQRKYDQLVNIKKSMLEKMFPKNGELVPEVRFAGFTDAWEQRKFSELVLIERGGSPRPIDAFITDSPDGLNWIKIGDAPTQGKYITKTEEKIRPEGLSKTRVVQPGDLILSNSMSFGRPYIMGISGCIHDGWLLIRNTKEVFDLTFLCHLLGSGQMLEQYSTLAAGSTVNNLNKELVGSAIVKYPALEEQRKIGAYLERVDDLITLHQRKLERLQNIKKACLEKMFV